ncbi:MULTISPECIES: extracellular solute-binding protein [unclassified Bradyrhizobium]|uniref:extracellular solute-binding protein n=1 Tax=Bradyrhizobium sp. IC4061 TaxID=2793808 RepID=UPI001CD569FA
MVVFQTAGVLAYDARVFPNGGPQNWVDFWDVKKFPGSRGLEALLGKHTIPLALLATGLAHQDIWPLTDEKLDRAFDKLNQMKSYVSKWWSAGGEPLFSRLPPPHGAGQLAYARRVAISASGRKLLRKRS